MSLHEAHSTGGGHTLQHVNLVDTQGKRGRWCDWVDGQIERFCMQWNRY